MTKRELIDEIIHRNPTAGPAFLAGFDDSDLAEYLKHLQWVTAPAEEPTTTEDGLTTPPKGNTEPAETDDEGVGEPMVAGVGPARASQARLF